MENEEICSEKIKNCRNCQGVINCNPLIRGEITAPVVFISEDPSEEADRYARDGKDWLEVYLGQLGQRFHKDWMPKLGITLDDLKDSKKFYITHTFKCYSGLPKRERDDKLRACAYFVKDDEKLYLLRRQYLSELDGIAGKEKIYFSVKKKRIILFGSYAFNWFWRGIFKFKESLKKCRCWEWFGSQIAILPHPSENNNGLIKELESGKYDSQKSTLDKLLDIAKDVIAGTYPENSERREKHGKHGYICPQCGVEITWGLSAGNPPEGVLNAGCVVEDRNYCPACGCLVYTCG